MAYMSIPRTEAELFDRDLTSPTSASPALPDSLQNPLSATVENMEDLTAARPDHTDSNMGGYLRSLTTSSQSKHSYDLVENEDYETLQMTPSALGIRNMAFTNGTHVITEPEHDLVPIRTASISRNLPLNHPSPDLQSLQGAYVKNVERLEESAERLSMTSSLEEELQKMKQEQRDRERKASGSDAGAPFRQFSTSSLSNSIIAVNSAARSGGYSPAGYITSPVGSIKSGAWGQPTHMDRRFSKSSRVTDSRLEPGLEGRPLDSGMIHSSPTTTTQPAPISSLSRSVSNNSEYDRPPTSSSNDTYRQAQHLFTDFDGTHYSSMDENGQRSRQISLNCPPRARDSKVFKEAQPGEKMIYYPAPVPVMLNLPKRLSKMNWAEREKKRLQALSDIPDEMRKSAAWLANEDGLSIPKQRPNSQLPPQLRASAFFDQSGVPQDVQLTNGSAVATLDSILDAAAFAPVSAFTDHPIAGRLGKEVYGQAQKSGKNVAVPTAKPRAKRRSSLSNLLHKRKSTDDLSVGRHSRVLSGHSQPLDDHSASGDELNEYEAQSIAPDADEVVDEEANNNAQDSGAELNSDDETNHQQGFSGAPTTLLAELQMRKAQQKLRSRTAANAFPNGMHSTLLELDAVTQLQQKARKTKHVTLAWEDHEEAERQNFDDDDVPLGILFPEREKQSQHNTNRPLGLMEKRELEDNEPLSHRRARMRGEPPPERRSSPRPSHVTGDQFKSPLGGGGLAGDELPEQENETLAQRVARLKEEKAKASAGDFAADLVSELGLKPDPVGVDKSKTPDIEETLGQRRKRLKEEAERNVNSARPELKPRVSMADLLQQNPVGHRTVSYNSRSFNTGAVRPVPQQQQLPLQHFGAVQAPYFPYQQQPILGYNYQNIMPGYVNMNGMQMPQMNMPSMPMNMPFIQDPMMGPPLNNQQRSLIDRWRQGIA